MPRSISRTATLSGVSANRCSVMSLCAVAVPDSNGPTRRGSNSESRRMASTAQLRIADSSLACAAGWNRRWCSASAASISVFFGSTARSVTPKRSAALRVPVLDHQACRLAGDRLAQHVGARGPARHDRLLEDRLFVLLWRRYVLHAGPARALDARRQVIGQEVLESARGHAA